MNNLKVNKQILHLEIRQANIDIIDIAVSRSGIIIVNGPHSKNQVIQLYRKVLLRQERTRPCSYVNATFLKLTTSCNLALRSSGSQDLSLYLSQRVRQSVTLWYNEASTYNVRCLHLRYSVIYILSQKHKNNMTLTCSYSPLLDEQQTLSVRALP